MKEKKYSISEASRLLEVENHVLRYWEEELELNIPRNEMGHRFYREEEIQLLNCIKELKNKGFQLKAVKEVLPDLEQKKLIDVHKLLATQVELENKEAEQEEEAEQGKKAYREGDEPTSGKIQLVQARDSGSVPLQSQAGESLSIRSNEEKMREFEEIMGRIIGRALRDQAEAIGDVMGDRISDRVIREMDDVLDEQEEREEARYKKLDEAIRLHQKARQEIAVTKDEGGRKKSLFFRKNKRKI
ncbi:MAG: helix-turn-helix domain-containing protein [Clostridiales bacterium]|nr:helix-turn-helix domain-containing protein [Clostridiales bacterium]